MTAQTKTIRELLSTVDWKPLKSKKQAYFKYMLKNFVLSNPSFNVGCFMLQVVRTAALTQWAQSMDVSPKGHLIAIATEGKNKLVGVLKRREKRFVK